MADRDDVRRAYDELAETYAAQRDDAGPAQELVEAFVTSLPSEAVVLDVGCGQGEPVLSHLAESVTAHGMDFSRSQLRLAAEAAPGARLVKGEMTRLPYQSGSVDAIVALWSLIHVPNADQESVLEEFARVLKPGGRLLVNDGRQAWTGENPDWLDSGVEMAWEIAGADTTADQLDQVGFRILGRHGVPESIEADSSVDQPDEPPWEFFLARLD